MKKVFILIIILLILFFLRLLYTKEKFTNDGLNEKQKKFKECLYDMKKILDENNTHFFLCWGTLLGQHRENKFIEHDHDIDIGILRNNFDLSLINTLTKDGIFKFKKKFGELDKNYECSLIHTKTNVPIDIFIFYKIKDDLYYTSTHNGKCSKTKIGFCKWARHLRGFKKVDFMGIKYNVPKNTEEYLEESYGKDWTIPKKFNYFEGLNQNHYKNLIE